jgi:hypothetical protein
MRMLLRTKGHATLDNWISVTRDRKMHYTELWTLGHTFLTTLRLLLPSSNTSSGSSPTEEVLPACETISSVFLISYERRDLTLQWVN